MLVDDGSSVKYSADTNFFTEKYEILWEHLPILVRVWQVEHKITWSPMIAAAPPHSPLNKRNNNSNKQQQKKAKRNIQTIFLKNTPEF